MHLKEPLPSKRVQQVHSLKSPPLKRESHSSVVRRKKGHASFPFMPPAIVSRVPLASISANTGVNKKLYLSDN